jgi:hypothetical protein
MGATKKDESPYGLKVDHKCNVTNQELKVGGQLNAQRFGKNLLNQTKKRDH